MSDLSFTCPHCKHRVETSKGMLGQTINCPSCQGQITLPELTLEPQAMPGTAPAPTAESVNPAYSGPLFLYIPVARLVILSLISGSIYGAYWIYRNWRYVKERDKLDIRPFWRGWFGFFFCHSLLRRIHDDKEARSIKAPSFSPNALATGWVILSITSTILGRLPDLAPALISGFIPSFLCLVPVQSYINSVIRQRNPEQPYYRWSSGHIVCLVLGIIIWALVFVGLSAER